MRYKAQFSDGWRGTWLFEALNDVRAWEIVEAKIKEHVKNIIVNIVAIWEIDGSDTEIRKLPDKENCIKLPKQKRGIVNKVLNRPMYKAYFSNGECSAPFIAENDEKALDRAKELANGNTIIGIDELEMYKPEGSLKSFLHSPITSKRKVLW